MSARSLVPMLLLLALAVPACGSGNEEPKPISGGEPQPIGSSTSQTGPAPTGSIDPKKKVQGVAAQAVAADVRRALGRGKNPVAIKKVRCPDDLPALKGSKTRCRLVLKNGSPNSATVKVTSASDTQTRYSIRLDKAIPR